MTLTAGDRLGPYEILGPIGSGGMGDVYRARDTRLARDVAIKVLPRELASDRDRLGRFEEEARALAALNHPNILAVYDVGVAEGVPYLVTELLEGDTLRAKLQVGPVQMRRAMEFAVSIATGLSAAHARHLVHRDLKPENIIVTKDGHLKLIDFGLARLTERPERQPDASTRKGTEAGTVLGTVGYMSPEQVRGQTVDHRADIFAFGAVFYEMLTGRRAFDGATPADTMSAILHAEVATPASSVGGVPPMVEQVVLRCLEKEPSARFQSTSDLVFALKASTGSSTSGPAVAPTVAQSGRRLGWLWPTIAAGSLVVAAAALIVRPTAPASGKSPVIAFDIALPAGMRWPAGPQFTTSPDNTKIAIVALDPTGVRRILIRGLRETSFRELKPTQVVSTSIAWSPDSRYLAFVAFGTSVVMFRVDVDSGLTEELMPMPCSVDPAFVTITWHATAGLVFSCNGASGLYQTMPQAKTAHILTTPDAREQSHNIPQLLPNGRGLLFTRRTLDASDEATMLRAQSNGDLRVVVGASQAAYSAGFLVFPRGDTLYAQPFDLARLETRDVPRSLGLPIVRTGRNARFTVNDAGTLLLLAGAPSARTRFTWFDREGKRGADVGPEGEYGAFDITARGDRIVTNGTNSMSPSLWVLDAERATPTRLTFGDQSDVDPNITSDGTVFFVRRSGPNTGLHQIPIDGGSERKLRDATVYALDDVSDDGQEFTYRKATATEEAWRSPVESGKDELVARGNAVTDQVHLSPDRRWVAYNTTGEAGRQEVYIVPTPAANAKWLVSANGGTQPIWRGDGRELFYLGLDGTLYSVTITTGDGVLKAGAARALFKTPIRNVTSNVEQYRATADGQRFIFKVPVGEEFQPPLRVILNWPGLLQ